MNKMHLLRVVLLFCSLYCVTAQVPCYFKWSSGNYYFGTDGNGFPSLITDNQDRYKLVSPGLNGVTGTVSFESEKHPGHYLRHQNFQLRLHKYQPIFHDVYTKDSTFYVRESNPSYVSFESFNLDGFYIKPINAMRQLGIQPGTTNALFLKTCGPFHFRSRAYAFKAKDTIFPALIMGLDDANGTPRVIPMQKNHRFKLVRPSLNEIENAVSFESEMFPGYYLRVMRNNGYRLSLQPFVETDSGYRNDATFKEVTTLCPGYFSYEFKNINTPRYLRYDGTQLVADFVSMSNQHTGCFTKENGNFEWERKTYSLVSKNYNTYTAGLDPQSGLPKIVPAIYDVQVTILKPGLSGVPGTLSISPRRHQAHYFKYNVYSNRDRFLYNKEFSEVISASQKQLATFRMNLGTFFNDPDYTTFQASVSPFAYVRHANFRLQMRTPITSNLEKLDASFYLHE